jgi:hypothetical protein
VKVETVLQFLTSLFQHSAGHLVELRVFGVRQGWFLPTPEGLRKLLRSAARVAPKHDVYFGSHPRKRRGGKAPDVACFNSLLADLDCGPGKPHPDQDAALDRLHCTVGSGDLPKPSWVNDSGRGVHVWWILDEPIPATPAGLVQYQSVMVAIRDILDGDIVEDAPRVMRLPGTLNHKTTKTVGEPADCKIIDGDGATVELADFGRLPMPMTATTGTTPESRPLPVEWFGTTRALVAQLVDRKVVAVAKVVKDGDGGILGAVLRFCPVCGGLQTDGKRAQRTALVTCAGGLKCKRASCKASGGLRASKWVRDAWPDDKELHALADGCRRQRTYIDPTIGDTIDVAQVELADTAYKALADALYKWRLMPVIDATTGTGKTYAFLTQLVAAVAAVEAHCLLQPRYTLMEETVATARAMPSGDRIEIVRPQGMARACPKYGAALRKNRLYDKTPPMRLCRRCTDSERAVCPYQAELARVGQPGTLTIAPHGMMTPISKRMPAGVPIVIDEIPTLFETVLFPQADIEAVRDAAYNPQTLSQDNSTEQSLWYHCRRQAGIALCEIMAAGVALIQKERHFRQVVKASDMLALLTKKGGELALARLVERLDFDPDAGLHPSLAAAGGDGMEPEVGIHARADFDDLPQALSRLCCGTDDLNGGVPFVYLEPDGTSGIGLWKRGLDIPQGRPVVILAAGGETLKPLIEAAYPDRMIDVRTVKAAETDAVTRHFIRLPGFNKGRMDDPEKLAAALSKSATDIARHVSNWARDNDKEQVNAAVISYKTVAATVRDALASGDVDPKVQDALDGLRAHMNLTLDQVGWYGNVTGSNAMSNCDVLVLMGSECVNIGEADALADALTLTGEAEVTGKQLVEWLGVHADMQAEGRARAARRDENNPLLILKIGSRGTFYSDEQTEAGKPGKSTSWPRLAVDLAAADLLSGNGWLTAGILADWIAWTETQISERLQVIPELFTPVRASVLRQVLNTQSGNDVSQSKIYDAVDAAGKASGAVKTTMIRVAVWETIPGSYAARVDTIRCADSQAAVCIPHRPDRSELRQFMRANWPAVREYVQERAAIREYNGGQLRHEAEKGALEDLACHLEREHSLAGLSWTDFEPFEHMGLWSFTETRNNDRSKRGRARLSGTGVAAVCA